MKLLKKNWQAVCLTIAICNSVSAQESENSVPFLMGLESGNAKLEKIVVEIVGRDVTIRTELRNNEAVLRKVGWYANTPQFAVLGSGETYDNKSFDDVRATYNGKTVRPHVYRSGYFMGHDISAQLLDVGLDVLPNANSDSKKLAKLKQINEMQVDDWQGYVNYAWTAAILPLAHAAIEVKYRALPEFALTEVDSKIFDRMVRQHCGDQIAARRRVKLTDTTISQVIVERYDVPIDYLRMHDVELSITEPRTNWLDARPILSLACGINNPSQQASIRGIIDNANSGISILVVSIPNDPSSGGRK